MEGRAKRIGVIGCGNISPQYFKGSRLFDGIEIVACSDIDADAARRRAEEFEVPRCLSVDELIEDDQIDIVLNLTTPPFHAPLNVRILQAGKHAYCEKPFCMSREEGKQVLQLAREKGLYIGCAPDTFLSAPLQTVRALIDEGFIGEPIGAQTAFACAGHEVWHPNPAFYYKLGGGPLLDMGPYYLTALANFFGPVVSVMASSKQSFAEREIASAPLKGKKIEVETPTHYVGALEYANGALVSALFSFDVKGSHNLPFMMLYGTEGTLWVPDANHFHGEVRVSRVGDYDWKEVALRHHYEGARAIGLADMAKAIDDGRSPRANGELAYHIFDVMSAFDESHGSGSRVTVSSEFDLLPGLPASEAPAPQF